MSGRVEQMRQELISNGVNPEIVNNMSEKQLEAACRERNIQIQSGLNNNANWGNIEDGFHRETAEVNGKEYELRPMSDEEKSQLRQTGVVPFVGKGGVIAKALIGLLGVGSWGTVLYQACNHPKEPVSVVNRNIILNDYGEPILDDAGIEQLKDKIKSDRLDKNQMENVKNLEIVKEQYESVVVSIDPVKQPKIREAVAQYLNNFLANIESLRVGKPEDMVTLVSEYLDEVKQILAAAEEDELKSANSGQAPDSGLQGDILSTILDDLNNKHLEKMKQLIETINKDIMSEVIERIGAISEASSVISEKQAEITRDLKKLAIEREDLYSKILIEPEHADSINAVRDVISEKQLEKRQELEELELERGNLYRENGIEPLK